MLERKRQTSLVSSLIPEALFLSYRLYVLIKTQRKVQYYGHFQVFILSLILVLFFILSPTSPQGSVTHGLTRRQTTRDPELLLAEVVFPSFSENLSLPLCLFSSKAKTRSSKRFPLFFSFNANLEGVSKP